MKLKPDTARTIYRGTAVKLVEGPLPLQNQWLLFIFLRAEGTVLPTQEWWHAPKHWRQIHLKRNQMVHSNELYTPNSYLQKQGHGALVDTPSGEWYYASLAARPWHHQMNRLLIQERWSTLGRETSIQKVEWDQDGWPRIVGARRNNLC